MPREKSSRDPLAGLTSYSHRAVRGSDTRMASVRPLYTRHVRNCGLVKLTKEAHVGEAKLGASVVDEVELYIAASAELLPALLLLCERRILAAADDRQIRGQKGRRGIPGKRLWLATCYEKCGDCALDKSKGRFEIRPFHVVEKDAANTAALLTVRDQKVFIGILLKGGVELAIVAIARPLELLVKVLGIFLVHVGRSQIRAATKPCDRALRRLNLKVTIVQMHCRGVRVVGMNDERDARGGVREVGVLKLVATPTHLCNSRCTTTHISQTSTFK